MDPSLRSASSTGSSTDEYRIVRPLGSSGHGVFLAHDRKLDRAVVLHQLPAEPAARAALLESARALARVTHPGVCRVHRIRESGDVPCVVQTFERGERLDSVTAPLPPDEVRALGFSLAGTLAALHAAGVAHGDIRAGRVIVSSTGAPHLIGLRSVRADADAAAMAADVGALVALLTELADDTLADSLARWAATSGRAHPAADLVRELSARGSRMAEQDNPYRGLRPFETAQSGLFFGREREVERAVARLRSEPWLLVAAPSGAGKSSFVSAGLVPAIVDGALAERAAWDVATMVPGARPLSALAAALAPVLERPADALEHNLRAKPGLAGRLARDRTDRGLLLVVDQLEETLTLATAAERDAFFAVLEPFGALAPGVRVVLTLRGDFLDRLGGAFGDGALARDLLRATLLLPPMRGEALRMSIVGPARARGFDFETTSMVDALIAEVESDAVSDALPLLSFVLSELWSERDIERRVLPQSALTRLGGATGALARHGDGVLASLTAAERVAARRVLLTLVTASGTRARRTRAELVGERVDRADSRQRAAEAALEALIRGRLVVAGETYEIAHEALVRAWPRLRAWLDEASDARMAARRLAAGATEWDRLGRTKELLWGAKQLQDLEIPGALEGASEVALRFAQASRRAAQRARSRRLGLALGVPLSLAVAGAAAWGVALARRHAALDRVVSRAVALDQDAEQTARAADQARATALAAFDRDDLGAAEKLWKQALSLEEDTDRQRREVGDALQAAFAIDPLEPAARKLYADTTLRRMLAAERLHRRASRASLRAQLDAYDDGSRRAWLDASAHVRVDTEPSGASLTLARYQQDPAGRLADGDATVLAAGERRELPPGSYLVVARAPDRATTRYPFVVRRGDDTRLRVVLPRPGDIPDGMVYVPAGRTVYGSDDDEPTRNLLTHQPMHDVDVDAFLVARTEVTNADYLAFLASLPVTERAASAPRSLAVQKDGRVAWSFRGRRLMPGEPYCSGVEPCVDWGRLPVSGASRIDGDRYAAWLARSGLVSGARLCTDREWERAARGADDRKYPGGNGDLGPTDACTLATYAGDATHDGPCAAGAHPASRSPFGVDDLAGNVWEWTAGPADIAEPEQGNERGGSYGYSGVVNTIANRAQSDVGIRDVESGLRVCASVR